jgi:hypothetical protein
MDRAIVPRQPNNLNVQRRTSDEDDQRENTIGEVCMVAVGALVGAFVVVKEIAEANNRRQQQVEQIEQQQQQQQQRTTTSISSMKTKRAPQPVESSNEKQQLLEFCDEGFCDEGILLCQSPQKKKGNISVPLYLSLSIGMIGMWAAVSLTKIAAESGFCDQILSPPVLVLALGVIIMHKAH